MRITGYRPSNSWIERQLDARWTRWLSWCAGGGLLTAAALGSLVAPHQTVIRMRYEIAQLSAEVERLDRERRTLLLEHERLTSLPLLARQSAELGLAPVPLERTVYLPSNGSLTLAGVSRTPQQTAGDRP